MPCYISKLFFFDLLGVENYTRWRITVQMFVSFTLLAVGPVWIFTKSLNCLHFRFSILRWYSWSLHVDTGLPNCDLFILIHCSFNISVDGLVMCLYSCKCWVWIFRFGRLWMWAGFQYSYSSHPFLIKILRRVDTLLGNDPVNTLLRQLTRDNMTSIAR